MRLWLGFTATCYQQEEFGQEFASVTAPERGCALFFLLVFFYRCRCENPPPAVTDTITCPRLGSFCSTCASPSYTESTARCSCSYTSLNELFLWQSACLSTGELSDLCSLTQKLLPTLLKQSPSSHTIYRRGPNTC